MMKKEQVMTFEEAVKLAEVAQSQGIEAGICDLCHVVRPVAEIDYIEDYQGVCVLATCRECK